MTTKYIPTTTVTLIATGGPHIWLFDSGWRDTRFTYGWHEPHGGPETLRRYAEVWQRLTPSQGELGAFGYAPGLKIRYADQDCKPFAREDEIATPTRITTAHATSNCYFSSKGSTAYGTYDGKSWAMNWVTGELMAVENLHMSDGRIFYTRNGEERNVWDGPFYNYRTGLQITDDMPAPPTPTTVFREEDEEMCPGGCGQPDGILCVCAELVSFHSHNPSDGVWTP